MLIDGSYGKLFYNTHSHSDTINRLVQEGKTVVADRYAYSGVTYTHAKGIDLDWCKSSDKGLPNPNLVLLLTAPIEALATRGDFGEERYENEAFLAKVKIAYDKLIENNWTIIDADGTMEEVKKRLEDATLDYLTNNQGVEVKNNLFMNSGTD